MVEGEEGAEVVTEERESLLCTWKGEMKRGHDFGDADCCGTRDTDAAVDERCGVVGFASLCYQLVLGVMIETEESLLRMKFKQRSNSFKSGSTPLS